MQVSDALRLKTLESQNAKLKKMLAEQTLDVAAPKEMLGKTSEALFEEECRGPGDEDQALQSAKRLRAVRDRSACASAQGETTGRHAAALPDEGTGF